MIPKESEPPKKKKKLIRRNIWFYYRPINIVKLILNQCESEILNLKFVKNSTENEVIQEIFMKKIKKFIKRWDREGEFLSWSEYLLANRDFEFIDSTSNRLERRNRIIKDKIIKFPGKRAIDVVFCVKNYFIFKNIDALSRLNTPLGKGIYQW